jgi:hypothetical protein
MPWLLIIQLLLSLPSIIAKVWRIYKAIKEFESGGFWDIARLIRDILGIILEFAPEKKVKKVWAKQLATELDAECKGLLECKKVGSITTASAPTSTLKLKERALAIKEELDKNRK